MEQQQSQLALPACEYVCEYILLHNNDAAPTITAWVMLLKSKVLQSIRQYCKQHHYSIKSLVIDWQYHLVARFGSVIAMTERDNRWVVCFLCGERLWLITGRGSDIATIAHHDIATNAQWLKHQLPKTV